MQIVSLTIMFLSFVRVKKTEPYYFEEIRVHLDLDSANIKIDGSCDSSPKSVVDYAEDVFIK